MQFTRCMHPVTSQMCLYLDLEGLDIYGNMSVEDQKALNEFLYFRIGTYEALKPKMPEELFQDVVRPVNKLFRVLSDRSLKILAVMFLDIHSLVLNKLSNVEVDILDHLNVVTDYISEYLVKVDASIDLYSHIRRIVSDDVVIPDFTNLGNRPQDHPDKTFSTDEVRLASEITVICKLMMPILGVIIETCKKKIDTHMKELYVVSSLRGYLNLHYIDIMMKLKAYVTNTIQQHYSENISLTFSGMSSGVVNEITFASLLVRRFVGVNLYQRDCNLMTYIVSFVRSSTANIGGRGAVESITKPNDISVNDEGNTSMLEAESMRSIATADLPALIEIAAEQTISQFIHLYELDVVAYEEALKYHKFNILNINPVSVYLLTLIFGRTLGGAYNVNLLTYEYASKLVIVLQLLLAKLGAGDLVPLLTAERSVVVKEVMTPVDNMIHANWKDSSEYIKLNKRFPYVVDNITWDTGLKTIVTYITKHDHIVKTAPVILESIGIADSYNGTVFQYNDGIIKSICRLIIMFTTVYVSSVLEE